MTLTSWPLEPLPGVWRWECKKSWKGVLKGHFGEHECFSGVVFFVHRGKWLDWEIADKAFFSQGDTFTLESP